MGFYQERILPLLIDLAMRQRNLAAYRNRLVSAAEGRVLEIGIGSDWIRPFIPSKAELVSASIRRRSSQQWRARRGTRFLDRWNSSRVRPSDSIG